MTVWKTRRGPLLSLAGVVAAGAAALAATLLPAADPGPRLQVAGSGVDATALLDGSAPGVCRYDTSAVPLRITASTRLPVDLPGKVNVVITHADQSRLPLPAVAVVDGSVDLSALAPGSYRLTFSDTAAPCPTVWAVLLDKA